MGKSLGSWKAADGAAKIAALSASYSANPPTELDGVAVSGIRDFSKGDMVDAEGDPIPAEKMIFVDMGGRPQLCGAPLRNGTQDQVLPLRPRETGRSGEGNPGRRIQASLDSLWAAVEKGRSRPFQRLNVVDFFPPSTM